MLMDTNYVCKLDGLFNNFSRATTAFLLATIAVDRYLHTCRPISRLVAARRAKFVCSGLFLVCAFSSVPLAVTSEFGSPNQKTNINGTGPYAAAQCVGGPVFDFYRLFRVAVSVAFITVSSVSYVLVFQRLKSSKIIPVEFNGRQKMSKIDAEPSMCRTGSNDAISVCKRSVQQFIPREAIIIKALISTRGSTEHGALPQRKVNIAANSRHKNALHEWTSTQNKASEHEEIIRPASPPPVR
ncbi:hypothetical protein DPMN_106774 [Dreissena polymorpha]|uniref:G-protein coupled receptors family 1 profile domain-containing protein n=1 Tax=Dreissena polymorpha TaxID=45954 RepID=A0A9D4K5V1_DREPO|nr:hypothetical protein DPMN_106774 [Dreissena polymorpha]